MKCKEKVDASRGAARKKKAQEKEMEVHVVVKAVLIWIGPPTTSQCIHGLAPTSRNFVYLIIISFVVLTAPETVQSSTSPADEEQE